MQVKQDLQMYLQQAEDLMSLKENEEKMVELCLLIIQCVEVKVWVFKINDSFFSFFLSCRHV